VAHAIRIRTAQAVQLKGNQELKDQITKCQALNNEVANAIQEIQSNGPKELLVARHVSFHQILC
jgi:hypothetical protein